MSSEIDPNKVFVFTGAGISAESGLKTFRDSDGLWNQYRFEEVASPVAWKENPSLVLEFYNQRRAQLGEVEPNAAHQAIAELQAKFEVVVVTQNVDDLHERAGSKNVIHVHGELTKARSTFDENLIIDIGYEPIQIGDQCSNGSQLRPHIVWFGEEIHNFELSCELLKPSAKVLVVGTSLTVFPAAFILQMADDYSEKIVIGLESENVPGDFKFIHSTAVEKVPHVVNTWMAGQRD